MSAATPSLGHAIAGVARDLPIDAGMATFAAACASLLQRDNHGPARKVNGLYFGLAELVNNEDSEATTWTPYLAGSATFSPDDGDWACDLAWLPDDRWAGHEPMALLSRLCDQHQAQRGLIESCLIEPLHTLYVAQFVRRCPRPILLGRAKSRGIGCGFDSGDLRAIGVVGAEGFVPATAT